jgi:subtilisin family serine protease
MRYGGREGTAIRLEESPDRIVVRTKSKRPFARARLGRAGRAALAGYEEEIRFDDSGVCVLRGSRRKSGRAGDAARAALKREVSLRFAGRVLRAAGGDRAYVYTENLFVAFRAGVPPSAVRRLLADAGYRAERRLAWAANAWFCKPRLDGIGRGVFYVAQALLRDRRVVLCHAETASVVVRRGAAPEQWHLQPVILGGERIAHGHANVVAAWAMSRGEGTRIAVIDDGFDVGHPELRGRVAWQWNAIGRRRDARHRPGDEGHGTCCAGVALGAGRRASGVAPEARLIAIRSHAGLGTAAEAECFLRAVAHGADVISCSWGPEDGGGPMALPDVTRTAIEHALRAGRGGRGTPIVWAAGNGAESVDGDGYASHDGVIAVAACDHRGRRCTYSDRGAAIFCAFPSGRDIDGRDHGIFTIDRRGKAGYNRGTRARGDRRGDYTNDFSGTSSAAPGVAGVVALVLSVAPELRVADVKRILARACRKIDRARGRYVGGRSPFYGYGRVDAALAVRLALAARRARRRRASPPRS